MQESKVREATESCQIASASVLQLRGAHQALREVLCQALCQGGRNGLCVLATPWRPTGEGQCAKVIWQRRVYVMFKVYCYYVLKMAGVFFDPSGVL